MLVPMIKLIEDAQKGNYAVGAFSVGNMEMVMGAIKAAEDTNTPIIIQIAEKRLQNSPIELMGPMMVSAAKAAKVDVAVHLDHGLTIDCIQKVLDYGFTSVMLDASLLPFEENVAVTKKVVELAKKYGATVESELGVVGGIEGDNLVHEIKCTDPKVAKEFCERTGIDCLAVAIGNAHGNYPVLPELRFDILEEIYKTCPKPLVLHGGTGITDAMFKRAISLGIRKINIATASFDALAKCAKQYLEGNAKPNYFDLSAAMVQGVYENVKRHILVFNNK